MRAPAFWWRPDASRLSAGLGPLASLYGAIAGRRMQRSGVRAAIPVICVGNFIAGGAGKTPAALAIAALLRGLGESPAFLSRGYGGRLSGPVRVDTRRHGPGDIGDEPLLLARSGLTIVSRNRPAGATLAEIEGASVVVMDDGLQNPSLVKDLAFAVVDGAIGIGNGRPLPAGPLRAAMSAQWPLADVVLLIGAGEPGEALGREAERLGKQVLRARLTPDPRIAAGLRGQRVLAFAGIGRPEKFFATLRECGAIPVVERAFADHHPYRSREIAALAAEASAKGLRLVTTEKDRVRIAALRGPMGGLTALPVALTFADEEALRGLLAKALATARAVKPDADPA